MGTTIQWVAFPDRPETDRPSGRVLKAFEELGRSNDWRFFELNEGLLAVAELDALIHEIATRSRVPAIGAFIVDSDFAFVVTVGSAGGIARLIVNASGAHGYQEGIDALRLCGMDPVAGEPAPPSPAFAAWSTEAPQAARVDQIEHILAKSWTFADDAVAALLGTVGLSFPESLPGPQDGFDQLELPFLGKMSFGRRRLVDTESLRFFMGYGRERAESFLGIWDRQAPGPPVRRLGLPQVWLTPDV